jgi:two-component system response regulator YesN
MGEYYRKVLVRLGHQVVALTENGYDLVKQCRALRPDVLITDLRMPLLNGDEAARTIWRDRHVPVIFISADREALQLACAGAPAPVAGLVKPIRMHDLEQAFSTLLLVKECERDLDSQAEAAPQEMLRVPACVS